MVWWAGRGHSALSERLERIVARCHVSTKMTKYTHTHTKHAERFQAPG